MIPILQFALMMCFFALELSGRQGGEVKSFRAGRADQGSTRLIVLALLSGVLIVPLLGSSASAFSITTSGWSGSGLR